MSIRVIVPALLAGTLAIGGCATPTPSSQTPGADAHGTPPDTTASALWRHVQAEPFTSWALWPGKGEFYKGTSPHGALLTTYLNPVALDAVTSGADSLPDGAIIVTQNFTSDSVLASTTVMYKAHGFDPEHHDWFWMKRLADGSVEASGRVASCQNCHGKREANDFIQAASIH